MAADAKKIDTLLKTAKGQIDGIINMLHKNRDCMEVCAQVLSCQSIMKKVCLEIIANHMSKCVKEGFENADEEQKQALIEDIITLFDKTMR